MKDSEFIQQFESCDLDPSAFDHSAHVRAAWIYLSRNPLPEAMICFRDALKRFASSIGKLEIYNETITFGFLLLIGDRIHKNSQIKTWDEFKLRNTDLLVWRTNPLKTIYGEDVLASPLAKKVFILPESVSVSRTK